MGDRLEGLVNGEAGFLRRLYDKWIYERPCYGIEGKEFVLFKIRTMKPGAEHGLEQALSSGLGEDGKIQNDQREVPARAWMRRYWIDELPNLANLLQGDLALLGLRPWGPSTAALVPEDLKEESLRHKPGLVNVGLAGERPIGETLVDTCKRYWSEKNEQPVLADVKYLGRAVRNILFRGYRG